MNSIPMDDIFLHIYILIDDWYQEHATEFRKGQPGQKPEFSDSEVMTVMIAMDYIPFPSERQFVEFVRANGKFISVLEQIIQIPLFFEAQHRQNSSTHIKRFLWAEQDSN